MGWLAWKDEYSVGVPGVDHEHQQLIEHINQAVTQFSGSDAEGAVSEMLEEIHAQISAHFALEERYMRQESYPRYSGHKEDHERLLEDIHDIMDDYEARQFYDQAAFSKRLHHWFSRHFSTWDSWWHEQDPIS